ncbi:hypothetical protein P7K49_032554 [Saguinus oedipus]|uniref:Uncharacterized protein n=1 Tax=Saguinus oedipus TaxID=9490 RepID=A0ABQ9TZR7_SAGOE|nr:hypothetical protein P7K49_032554 [Saguinus oedipus]
MPKTGALASVRSGDAKNFGMGDPVFLPVARASVLPITNQTGDMTSGCHALPSVRASAQGCGPPLSSAELGGFRSLPRHLMSPPRVDHAAHSDQDLPPHAGAAHSLVPAQSSGLHVQPQMHVALLPHSLHVGHVSGTRWKARIFQAAAPRVLSTSIQDSEGPAALGNEAPGWVIQAAADSGLGASPPVLTWGPISKSRTDALHIIQAISALSSQGK